MRDPGNEVASQVDLGAYNAQTSSRLYEFVFVSADTDVYYF